MKIAAINGNNRHGSTWNCMDSLVSHLSKQEPVEMTEFFLPRDMPEFCNGCFSCIMNGEQTCPHAAKVTPIVEAMLASDVIILTSPVYAMDISGQMKALLDHLCFMWMSHRPHPGMFDKIAITVNTTAGAGLGHTSKTLRNSLKFWGVKKIYSMKVPVAAMRWKDVTAKTQAKVHKKAGILANRILKSAKSPDRLHNPFFRSFFFTLMTGMMKKNTWNLHDRNHWETHGWLSGTKPFRKTREAG